MGILLDLERVARADPRPAELTVPSDRVWDLVDDIRSTSSPVSGLGSLLRIELHDLVIAGDVKLDGLPVRVIA